MTAFRLVSAFTYLVAILFAVAAPAAAQDPRIYQYYPANFTTVGTQTITVSFYGCSSASINGSSGQVFVNGVPKSAPTTYPSGYCALANKMGFSTQVTLRSGGNTIDMKFCTVYGSCGTASIWVTYTPPNPGVAVTPDGGSATVYVNTSSNFVFRITNTGNVQSTPMTSISSCSPPLTSCSVPPGGASMAPGEGRDITVSYNSTGAGPGQLGMSVYWMEYPSTSDVGSATISVVNPPVYSVAVSVDDAEPINMSGGATSLTQRYTIANTSQYTTLASTFQIDMTPSGIVTSCPAQNPITLSPGGAQSIFVTCQIGASATANSGTVRLTATTYSPVTMSSYVQRTVNTTPYYAVSVTPVANSNPEPARATSGSRSFTVRNDSRNTGATSVTLSRICSYALTCSPQMSPVTIYEGSSSTVNVPYNIQWTGTYGTLQLNAGIGGASNSGSITVNTTAAYAVVVTPEFTSVPVPPGGQSGTARFTIFNNSTNTGATRSFALSTTCTMPLLTGCGASPGSIDLADQATASLAATLTFNVSPNGTSGTATLRANSSGVPEGTGSTTITTSPYYSVIASPVNVSEPPLAAGATSATVQFQVYNNSRNTSGQSYVISLAASGSQITASGCPASPSPASVPLAQGASTNQVYLTCSVGPVGSSGTMTVTPSGPGFVATAQAVTVTIPPWYWIAVTVDSLTRTLPPRTARDSLRFKLKDASRNTTTATSYPLSANCYAPTSCSASQGSLSLARGDSAFRYLVYDVGRVGTTGTVALAAIYGTANGGASSTVFTTPSYTVAYVPPSLSRTINVGSSGSEVVRIQNTSWNTSAAMRVESRMQACSNTTLRACTMTAIGETLAQDALSSLITVRYSGGGAGTETIALDIGATVSGNPTIARTGGSVAVTVSNTGPLSVVTAGLNPGTSIDRGDCLMISAGDAAAYECGDLRIVHALPANVTMNKARAPVLVYNSRYAKPGALIQANVIYTGGQTPTTLRATVTVPGQASPPPKSFNWNAQCAGQTCRIVIPVDATTSMTTGLYPYTLQLDVLNGGTTLATSNVVTDTIVIVNRTKSPFGAGWWLEGFESLVYVNDSTRLWVGGDGSTRLYRRTPSNANAFTVEPAYDYPDTLSYVAPNWRRALGNNAYVQFDNAGHHTNTVNALGHQTTFAYLSSDPNTLERISLPVPAGSTASRTYTFAYLFPSGIPALQSVATTAQDGVARVVALSDSAQSWITGITDPDNTTQRFGYDAAGRLVLTVSKLRDSTHFAFDAAGKLTQAKLDMFRGNNGAAPIITGFRSAESRSAANAGDVPRPLGQVYTLLDGPRTDVLDTTRFYVNAFGAPDSVFNALSHRTALQRQDARFVSRATLITNAVGFSRRTWFNNRALADSIADFKPFAPVDTVRDAITRYTWHAKWTHIASVRSPTGVSTTLGYSDTDPLRLWQDIGPDTSHRVRFDYDPGSKLLISVKEPSTAAATIQFETVLGNMAKSKSPRLFETRFWRDNAGRDSVVESQIDTTGALWQKATVLYDRMGRVREKQSLGPKVTTGPLPGDTVGSQTVIVQTTYDDDGDPVLVTRRASPDPARVGVLKDSSVFDPAGRKIVAVATDLATDSMAYDAAGNMLTHFTRRYDPINRSRRLSVTMDYDVLNRVLARHTPAVDYPQRNEGIPVHYSALNFINTDLVPPGGNPPYPRYPNNGSGLSIPADDALFEYDVLGHVTVADNRDAHVRRSYYRNGQLRGDTLYTRVVDGTAFNQHVYGLEYTYDLDGRRTQVKHPGQLAAGAATDRANYAFDPITGVLSSVTDIQGNQFLFHYTARGDVDSLYMPLGFVEGYGYDADGALSRHTNFGGGWNRDATLTYDARGKILVQRNKYGYADTTTAIYSGLGHVAFDSVAAYGYDQGNKYRQITRESFSNDALANLLTTSSLRRQSQLPCNSWPCGSSYTDGPGVVRAQVYQAGTSRYMYGETVSGSAGNKADTASYDEAGNTVFTTPIPSPRWSPGSTVEDRVSYYASDGTLYAADYRWVLDRSPAYWGTTFEEYRYDALGRRIWLRSRRFCENSPNFECNLSFVRRTVWDGDAELYEIQMPGWVGTPADTLENDTAPVKLALVINNGDRNSYFGRVAYSYGMALDRPMSVVRFRYANSLDTLGNNINWAELPTFSVVPLWNARGKVDMGYFAPGGSHYCLGSTKRCVFIVFPAVWDVLAYSNWNKNPGVFHGTLIEDKQDKTGTWYRRNRQYDPNTGRFTQEDPIGLAGGSNLYGFADGDPVTFSDPFGLKVCFGGTKTAVQDLSFITKAATNTTFTLDAQNCIIESSVKSLGNSKFDVLRTRFMRFVNAKQTFGVAFSRDAESAQIDPHRIDIFENAEAEAYQTGKRWGKCDGGQTPVLFEQVLSHELVHHEPMIDGKPNPSGTRAEEKRAVVNGDNIFNAAVGRRARCAY